MTGHVFRKAALDRALACERLALETEALVGILRREGSYMAANAASGSVRRYRREAATARMRALNLSFWTAETSDAA